MIKILSSTRMTVIEVTPLGLDELNPLCSEHICYNYGSKNWITIGFDSVSKKIMSYQWGNAEWHGAKKFDVLRISFKKKPWLGHCCCCSVGEMSLYKPYSNFSWWRRQMETFSMLLALCVGNSPVNGEVPSQRPVMGSFDAWINSWVYNREAGDLRCLRAHYDVIVM